MEAEDLEMDFLKAVYLPICPEHSYVLNIIIRLKDTMCIAQPEYLRNKFYKMLKQRQ